jgi:hypothetical protein
MHARMLCMNAPLQICEKRRPQEAPEQRSRQENLQTRSPVCGNLAAEIGAYRLSYKLL